ncbi:MAG TPA: hypothetical protein VL981_01735 [Candidatus Methylacidiphilales bacterium]|nr:hypothetical protein [Candidatus Methylacidiphilales bacterium]
MEDSPYSHSPFWPLQILVVYLIAWVGYHVFTLNKARLADEQQIQQVTPQAEAALTAKNRLVSLAQDIDNIAAKDAAAAEIVKEFKIHGRENPSGSNPSPSSTGP